MAKSVDSVFVAGNWFLDGRVVVRKGAYHPAASEVKDRDPDRLGLRAPATHARLCLMPQYEPTTRHFGLPDPRTRSDRTVCVADDDATVRTMLGMVLGKWGYQVDARVDGDDAFASLSAVEGPRLALLDWMMPGMDGVQACRRLREEFPSRNYYLVLLTSRSDAADVQDALRSGADDFISKPFSLMVLQARIEVGFRTLDMQKTIAEFADRMQRLASSRASQLVHADRMASLGLISASVAHEINNPASFIAVNVRNIADLWPSVAAALGPDATDSDKAGAAALVREMPAILQEMDDGVERIRQITSELRAFSRTEHSTPRPLDVVESLEKSLRIASIRMKGHVDVDTTFPDSPPRVVADATRLEQVFLNLVLNALDAMEDVEHKRLTIQVAKSETMLDIRIRDSGSGIAPETAESLFQPFFTTKPAGKGTGLGLFISRGIVEEIGGVLLLEPPDGSGASFLVRLPILEEEIR